jgi:rare lipoprotein A
MKLSRLIVCAAAVLASLALGGCGASQPSYVRYGGVGPPPGTVEAGLASYYSDSLEGNHTANGETYDGDAMTAAHRTLPFGTVVRVRRVDNGREVTVRINDRGPFVRARIIDLSRAAAEALQMVRTGVTRVEVEVLSVPPPRTRRTRARR